MLIVKGKGLIFTKVNAYSEVFHCFLDFVGIIAAFLPLAKGPIPSFSSTCKSSNHPWRNLLMDLAKMGDALCSGFHLGISM